MAVAQSLMIAHHNNPVAALTEYELRHLAAHLEASGRDEDLHRMLAMETSQERNAWYEAKEAIGDISGFLADVATAWQSAEPDRDIAKQINYALIHSCIVSLVANYPPELLVSAVEHQCLLPEVALAIIEQVPEDEKRADTLIRLINYLPNRLLAKVLVLAQSLQDKRHLAKVLIALIPHLPEDSQGETVQEALTVAQSIEEKETCAKALARLTSYLPEGLGQRISEEALAIAKSATDIETCVKILSDLALHLPGAMRKKALREALATVHSVTDERRQVRVLVTLLPCLSTDLMGEALRIVHEIGDSALRAETLVAAVPNLPESWQQGTIEEILALAKSIVDEGLRVRILGNLILHSSETCRPKAVREILTSLQMIGNEKLRYLVLTNLLPNLPESLRPEIQEEASILAQALLKTANVRRLMPHLPSKTQREVLQSALSEAQTFDQKCMYEWVFDPIGTLHFVGGHSAPDVLAELAPYLTGEAVRDALIAVRQEMQRFRYVKAVYREQMLAQALVSLGPHLSETLQKEALEIARSFKKHRVKALHGLALHFPKDLQRQTLQEALNAARAIDDAVAQVEILVGFVHHVPKVLEREVKQRALEVVRSIRDEEQQAQALATLASCLSEDLMPEAFKVAWQIENEWVRAMALCSIAPYFSASLAKMAIRLINRSKRVSSSAVSTEALKCLWQVFRHPDWQSGLTRAQRNERLRTLRGRLGDLVSEPLALQAGIVQRHLQEALVSAGRYSSRNGQDEELAPLVPHLVDWAHAQTGQAYATWKTAFHQLSYYPRKEFFRILHTLMPFVLALVKDTEETAESIFYATQAVTRWWP